MRIFRKLKLAELIDSFTFSYGTGFMKPHPGIFEKAKSSLGVSVGKVLMIGDSPEADILGAKQCGFDTCLYDNKGKYQGTAVDNPTDPDQKPDFAIDSFKELKNIL